VASARGPETLQGHYDGQAHPDGPQDFESIGKPLPGRTKSRADAGSRLAGARAVVVNSLDQALRQASDSEELVAIGGAEIYRLLMPFARRIYLTHVHADIRATRTFPIFDPTQ